VTGAIVVIGDAILDIDRCGESERLSPEAPVPVLHHLFERRRAGGAALAAQLAAGDGSVPVVLVTPLADDDAAAELRELLRSTVTVIALPWTGTTPVKTRLLVGSHPVARIDEGGEPGTITSIAGELPAVLGEAAAILVSDYGRGAAADDVLRRMITAVVGRIPVIWDPHPKGPKAIPGVSLVTPNESELRQLVNLPDDHRPGDGPMPRRVRAAQQLARQWRARGVCVTLGRRGAMLCLGDNPPLMVPAEEVTGADTCGAGDSFAASVACAIARGALPSEAVTMATASAGRFVASGGAAGFDPAAHLRVQSRGSSVADLLDRVRRNDGVVVATGGCFDLLHAGHVATLEAARALGDCLIVCLNSDESVRRLKGPPRPLQPAADRARVLCALAAVDAVVVFGDDTPSEVLRTITPDLWVKGGDYSGLELPEQAVLAEWGGQVVTVPYLPGRSTSALVELAAPAGSS
jgi:D-beta-D-heptose 7-phosphate kinase/D-beta-D-heptose 1-phosphate adenosyltransferase